MFLVCETIKEISFCLPQQPLETCFLYSEYLSIYVDHSSVFFVLKVPTLPQSTSGHGHNNTTPHIGPHTHSLAVQSQAPAVVPGLVHPPTPIASVQGHQQQFQRLKVWITP